MTVHEWLESERDYEAGRQLYAALSDNDRVKRMLSSGPNHYNREALAWELTKLKRAGVVVDVLLNLSVNHLTEMRRQFSDTGFQAEVLNRRPNATESLQKVVSSRPECDKLLEELKDARRPLYDERGGLHAQLEVVEDEEDRRLLAVRIMALTREIDANWHTTHYVQAHGELPPPPAAPPGLDTLPVIDLLKRRYNLRSLVSKLKKRPDRADDLARIEATLQEVETLLNPAK